MAQGTYHILTFGCQMNVNDSFWLARALQRRGFVESSLDKADVVVLNTCSVRDKPEQKVYTALGHIRQQTRSHAGTFVVVAGCVAQQIGSALFKRFPQVRLVVGGDGLSSAPEAIVRLYEDDSLRLDLTGFTETYPERDPALPDAPDALQAAPVPDAVSEGTVASAALSPIAYVNIMQGCDNFCSYCIVPFTRGRQKSRTASAIVDECQQLLNHGVQEITLLGQNVNAFGLDKRNGQQGDTSFADLLRQIAALQGQQGNPLPRLRFVTPHPKDLSAEVIALFGSLPNLCPRLHLPMQAGSDTVLSRMGRRYDMARYLSLVDALRKACPDIALSTDLIVGFPGESEAEFQETLAAVEQIGFMSSFSFCYSDRPGTAAERLKNKIDPEEKAARLERLQALQERLSSAWLASRVGCSTDVLLEGLSRKQDVEAGMTSWQGRDPWGDVVNVLLPEGVGGVGQLVPVRISAAKRHSLLATCAV